MRNYTKITEQLHRKLERQTREIETTRDHLAAIEQLELNDQASRPQVKTDPKK